MCYAYIGYNDQNQVSSDPHTLSFLLFGVSSGRTFFHFITDPFLSPCIWLNVS